MSFKQLAETLSDPPLLWILFGAKAGFGLTLLTIGCAPRRRNAIIFAGGESDVRA